MPYQIKTQVSDQEVYWLPVLESIGSTSFLLPSWEERNLCGCKFDAIWAETSHSTSKNQQL